MNQSAGWQSVALIATLCVVWILGTGWMVAAAEDVDILQVIQSFQRLAMLDPVAAGSVWMTEQVAEEWSEFVGLATTDETEAFALFSHAYGLTNLRSDGTPFGALYNLWVGSLLVFEMDARATTITGFALFTAEDQPIGSTDAQTFANELMARIERVDARFAEIVQTNLTPGDSMWTPVGSKIDEYALTLRWLHGVSLDGSRGQANALSAVDRLSSGSSDGALDLLRRENEDWVTSLFPVWAVTGAGETFVALSSTEAPLDFVSMRVVADESSDPIRSVSVIRLFDRLTTRGGEGS